MIFHHVSFLTSKKVDRTKTNHMPKTIKKKEENNAVYGSPPRKAFNVIPTNTPTKGKGKEKQLNSRPRREARRQSKKLDFRNEDEFFDAPAVISPAVISPAVISPAVISPAVHIHTDSPERSPLDFNSQSLDFNVHNEQQFESDYEKVIFSLTISLTLFSRMIRTS
jgi:hypothetical protein